MNNRAHLRKEVSFRKSATEDKAYLRGRPLHREGVLRACSTNEPNASTKRALCIRTRALCICKRTLYLHKRALVDAKEPCESASKPSIYIYMALWQMHREYALRIFATVYVLPPKTLQYHCWKRVDALLLNVKGCIDMFTHTRTCGYTDMYINRCRCRCMWIRIYMYTRTCTRSRRRRRRRTHTR